MSPAPPAPLDLIAARHGNTFERGAPVRWIGKREDLPLTGEGLAQAAELGRTLAAAAWTPDRVLASSLARARDFAARALAAARIDLTVAVDARLDEVDYGPWGGLTSAEIEARGDGAALAAWSSEGAWPAAFRETEREVRERVARLGAELAARGGRVLVVSSNGVLRYFLALAGDELERRRAAKRIKVGTGRAGRLRCDGGGWRVLDWDASPAELLPSAGDRP